MENKNVFIAIVLSMAVLLSWATFVERPQQIDSNTLKQEKIKKVENNNEITPNINQTLEVNTITRNESINKKNRVKINNESIIGSISLNGGLLDDISFKKHKQDLKNNLNVEFLNPKETENGYYVETGWTSIGNKIKVPSINSTWTVSGNKILSNGKPVTLEWENGEGIIFKKKFEIPRVVYFYGDAL